MSRTFQDDELLLWEAYAAAPLFGARRGARIMFQCLTDRIRRPRMLVREDEDRAAVEEIIESATDADLLTLLRQSEPVS